MCNVLKMVACGALMIQSYLVTEDDNKKLNANYYYYYYYCYCYYYHCPLGSTSCSHGQQETERKQRSV